MAAAFLPVVSAEVCAGADAETARAKNTSPTPSVVRRRIVIEPLDTSQHVIRAVNSSGLRVLFQRMLSAEW
jgi:hypothetical protein